MKIIKKLAISIAILIVSEVAILNTNIYAFSLKEFANYVVAGLGLSNGEIDISKNQDESLTAKISDDKKTLTISGTGEMKDFSSEDNQWGVAVSKIKKVIISDNITKIGNYAFANCTELVEINLPSTLTSIGSYAFKDCGNLKEIQIPNSVNSIGAGAFYRCTKLNEINIPTSLTKIENSTFSNCSSITSITIPNSVTSIEIGAFLFCSKLSSITIPGTVLTIGYGAFSFCTGLTSVTITQGVKTIANGAFEFCSNIETINIPKSVTSLEIDVANRSFCYGCSKLKSISVDADNANYSSQDGVLFDKNKKVLLKYPEGKTDTTYTIPSTVNTIGEFAFYHVTNLKRVILPNSVTEIANYAFYTCTGIEYMELPDLLTKIGNFAFFGCNKIINISLEDSIETIGVGAFKDCTSLKSIDIPSSIVTIDYITFSGCTSLKNVNISKSVTTIGNMAFEDCASLEEINVSSDNVNYSSEDGILFNKNKTELIEYPEAKHDNKYYEIPNTVTKIGSKAFYKNKTLEQIYIPDTVTDIGEEAFKYCTGLRYVLMLANVSTVPAEMFSECTNLSLVKLSDSIIRIGAYAFQNCKNLITLIGKLAYTSDGDIAIANQQYNQFEIPSSIEEIGEGAFQGCDSISIIEIDGDVLIGTDAYNSCSSLSEIIISDSNTKFSSENGVLFNKDKTKLIFYPPNKSDTSYVIPSTVKELSENAFDNCKRLNSITIPNSVTNVGENADYKMNNFDGCSSLNEIIVTEGNRNYSSVDGVLYSKDSTQLIRYPENKIGSRYRIKGNVTTIYANAFKGNKNLTIVEIPSSVVLAKCTNDSSIGIMDNSNRIKVYYEDETRVIRELEYSDSYSNVKFQKVMDVSANQDGSIYATLSEDKETLTIEGEGQMLNWMDPLSGIMTVPWYDYRESIKNVELSNGITSIGSYAFDYFKELASINLPNSITEIGNSAFEDCIKITTVNIPNGVNSIEDNTFKNCEALKNIQIPNSVTSIGKSAFEKTGLETISIPDSITNIGERAFFGCSELPTVAISDSVTNIGNGAFSNCSKLTKITVTSNNSAYSVSGGVLFNKGKTELIVYPAGKTNTSYDIPTTVKTIKDSAFYGSSILKELYMPIVIETIEKEAFRGCTQLEKVRIPNSVKKIEKNAFIECSDLSRIEIPSSVNNIGEGIIDNSHNIIVYYERETSAINDMEEEYEDYSSNVVFKSIDEKGTDISKKQDKSIYAILSEDKKTLYIEGYGEIKDFSETNTPWNDNKNTIEKVVISKGVTQIGKYTFNECTKLNNITIPNTITTLRSSSFKGCTGLTAITVPNSVSLIEAYAFEGCTGLTKFNFPTKVTEIKNSTFNGCTALNNITIPENIKKIGTSAFEGCTSLTMYIPNTLESVGGTILSNNENVTVKYQTIDEQDRTADVVENMKTKSEYNKVNFLVVDTTKPKLTVEMNPNDKKDSVVVSIKSNEPLQAIEGWELSEDKKTLSKTYTEKGTETVTVKDLAGNEVAQEFEITEKEIDKEPPTLNYEVKVSDDHSSANVVITSNEEVKAVEGWTLSEDKKTLTKEYKENGSYSVEVEDLVGNKATQEFNVSGIDLTPPEIVDIKKELSPNKEKVTVTITANEELQKIDEWNLSEDKKSLTKEFTENGTTTIEIKDIAGNKVTKEITVEGLDRISPKITLNKTISNDKKSATITLTSDEAIQGIEGWTLSSDKKVLTKTYTENANETIRVKDLAGNVTEQKVEITELDTIPPVIEQKQEVSDNEDAVTVTLTSNEEVEPIEGWTLSSNKKVLTKTYTDNVDETIRIRDLNGNEVAERIKIEGLKYFKVNSNCKIENEYIKKIQPNQTYADFVKNIITNLEFIIKDKEATVSGTSDIKTGETLTVGNNTYTLIVIGDVNGDGDANIADIMAINMHRLNKSELSELNQLAGDVNGDNKVNIQDIMMINMYRLGKTTNL